MSFSLPGLDPPCYSLHRLVFFLTLAWGQLVKRVCLVRVVVAKVMVQATPTPTHGVGSGMVVEGDSL